MLSSISKNCWYQLATLFGGNKLCPRMVWKEILAVRGTQCVFYKKFQYMKQKKSKIKGKFMKAATETTSLHVLCKDQQSS